MPEYGLRPMGEADLDDVLCWRNADPVRRRMYSEQPISAEEHAAWWLRARSDPQTRLMMFEHTGAACAVVGFTRYTGVDGSATLAFYGNPARKQRQIAAQLELAAFEYAFDTLQVRRLEGEVIGFNMSVAQFHLRQGARLEGSRRQAYVRDGVAHDVQSFGMLREEWYEEIGPTLRRRAEQDPTLPDWTGHAIRAPLPISERTLPEAVMAFEIASRLREALPMGPVRLRAQSLVFASAPSGGAAFLRARVVTHVGYRILWSVRVMQEDALLARDRTPPGPHAVPRRQIAEGGFEFRQVREGEDR